MFELFREIVFVGVPIFVIVTMLNVGLTQRPAEIAGYLKHTTFVVKMLAANFVAVPLVMIVILRVTDFEPSLQAGLLVFSLGAGAPFLIVLAQIAKHHIALGAAVMILLTVATVVFLPLVLPLLLAGSTVDSWAVARALFSQMLLPIPAGMAAARFIPGVARAIQPWVAKVSNIMLYIVVAATFIGYFPILGGIVRSGALLAALVFVLAAFGIGFVAGHGEDHLEDVGALGTGQRNTAAGLIVATQNFEDRNVLVVLTLANVVGLVLLIGLARFVGRDNPGVPTTS